MEERVRRSFYPLFRKLKIYNSLRKQLVCHTKEGAHKPTRAPLWKLKTQMRSHSFSVGLKG
ncbi:MAG: hypothetical protein DMF68_14160 [Acidobacteria bacterium]|nr:MAG: hypothetical protein DMF68_14160 [Acidobacteriota bacterium]